MNDGQKMARSDATVLWRENIRTENLSNYHYCMAVALEREGSLNESLAAYRRALEVRPDLAVAAYRLRALFEKTGRAEDAEAVHRNALATDPHYAANAMVSLALELMEGDSWDDGEAMLQSAISGNCLPTLHFAEACFVLGRQQQKKGDIKTAIKTLSQGIAAQPNHSSLLEQLGSAFLNVHDAPSAAPLLEKGITLEPFSPTMHYQLAWANLFECRFVKAATLFEKTIKLGYKFPYYPQWRQGLALLALGRYEDVLRCYAQPLASEQESSILRSYRGLCLQAMGRLEEALEEHEKAVLSPQHMAEKISNRALTESALGNNEKSLELHKEAMKAEDEPWPAIAYSYTLVQLGRLDEAEAIFTTVAKRFPTSASYMVHVLTDGWNVLGPLCRKISLGNELSEENMSQ
ncbi:tetratricopeptide repeat protein [Azospirillum aestuarii]|uniref:tetratricopeptide repeat protein n=1 Tax=Azospirillum aestuarii TaxID=2802052 RepID=UPI00405523D8